MKCAKIDVLVNRSTDDDVDLEYHNVTLDEALQLAIDANYDWTSIVLIVVRS